MKDLLKIIAYMLGSAILAALVAPVLFHLGEAAFAALGWQEMQETSFRRYFSRAFLIAAVALLWPLMRWLHVRSTTELGLARNPRRWSDLGFGFGVCVALLLAYGAALIFLGIYELKDPLPWHRLKSLALTAVAVALIEEAFFRGALQGVVQRTASKPAALISVAALFAILHFLKPPEESVADSEVRWWSGFAIIPLVFRQFQDPALLLAGFSTLFAFGLALGIATQRSRSLWMAIGIHAGAIVGSRVVSILAKPEKELLPWVGSNLRLGIVPCCVLLLLAAITVLYTIPRNRADSPKPDSPNPGQLL